jgi:rhamnosyltransferase
VSKVSIVIRCYNEEQHIGRLLSGLMQQTVKDLEIIVVDSGSTDSTVSIASSYPIKLVSIKPENFSFGRSLNLGCEAATGEFIVIASAHVYPEYQDWIEKLIAPFDDPDIALTYGKQRGNTTTKYSEQQIFITWFPDHQTMVDKNHPFCNNANAAIRRSLWKEIPYDESLTGLEDLHWAKQAIASGYRITYVPEAEIIHVHDETPKRIYNRYRREAIALKNIYPQEHFYFWDFIRLFITNLISDYFHGWHDGVLFQNITSIPIFRFMQFWGTYQGFTQQGSINNQLKETFYYPRRLSRQETQSQLDNSRPIIDYSNNPKTLEKNLNA